MERISVDKLADLLKNGFRGVVQFEGEVTGRIDEIDNRRANARFYEASGKFTLADIGDGIGYTLQSGESNFKFEPRDKKKISYSSGSRSEKTRDCIIFEINIHENAVLQIDPRNMVY